MLGYGLTDVKTRKGQIADSRINSKSPLLDWDHPDRDELGYIRWIKRHRDAEFSSDDLSGDWNLDCIWVTEEDASEYDFDRSVVRQPEYGLPNVLCIKPLGAHDWYRHASMIDWVEETWIRPGTPQRDHVEVLDEGIYPYEGWMDSRTGEKVHIYSAVALRRAINVAKVNPDALITLDQALDVLLLPGNLPKTVPFATPDEVVQFMVPTVPREIRDMCEWGKLFKDELTWTQLRPMLYTWWA
jgi:hypothetical protein